FALRTGIIFSLAGLAILALGVHYYPDDGPDKSTQRTLLLSVLILLGITALWRTLEDGEEEKLQGDTRFRLLGIAAVPVYLLAMYWPVPRDFFRLAPLGGTDWLWVLSVAGVGYGLSWLSDQWHKR